MSQVFICKRDGAIVFVLDTEKKAVAWVRAMRSTGDAVGASSVPSAVWVKVRPEGRWSLFTYEKWTVQ